MDYVTESLIQYYTDDFQNPKACNVEFEKFLAKNGLFKPGSTVCDIACGTGSGTSYFAKNNLDTQFAGIDYNDAIIKWGNGIIKEYGINNLLLETGDWYKLDNKYINQFDGIFSIHSFCTFKMVEKPIDALVELNPNWIALNSLFYEGPLDVLIHIRNHKKPEISDDNPDGDFNIFSLEIVQNYFKEKGYHDFIYEKFRFPSELKKPAGGRRGTYTVKTEFDEKAQFTGPVYLPWYFVLAKK